MSRTTRDRELLLGESVSPEARALASRDCDWDKAERKIRRGEIKKSKQEERTATKKWLRAEKWDEKPTPKRVKPWWVYL